MSKTYKLKPIIAARLGLEITVALILVLLPFVLTYLGIYQALSIIIKIILPVLSFISLLILPAYGFTTWKVKIDHEGISTHALFQKHFVEWDKISGLFLKTNWGWRRYIIECKSNQTAKDNNKWSLFKDFNSISFPVWLTNVQELVESIRSHLPNRGRSNKSGNKIFTQDIISIAIQFIKLSASMLFVALLWFFFLSTFKQGTANHISSNSIDQIIVLVVCSILTLIVLLQAWLIISMPKAITLSPNRIYIQTCFFHTTLTSNEIKHIYNNILFLPNDGLLLLSTKGLFYVSAYINDFDELTEGLRLQ